MLERVLGVGDGINLEAVLGQRFGNHVADQELVLDQQDPGPVRLYCHDPFPRHGPEPDHRGQRGAPPIGRNFPKIRPNMTNVP